MIPGDEFVGYYPSVSTILGSRPNPYIEEWKAKVGEAVAKKISKKATDSGTLVHENIENYLLGRPSTLSMFDERENAVVKGIKPFLDTIEKVFCLETSLWSDSIRVAGTIDCAAYIGGVPTVIDWKTSNRIKSTEDIHHYFEQAACYALMIYERTGIPISDILICMVVYDQPKEPLFFPAKVQDHLPGFIKCRKDYNSTTQAKELLQQCKLLQNSSSL